MMEIDRCFVWKKERTPEPIITEDDMDEMGYGMEETEDTNEVVGASLAGIAGLVAAAGGMAKLKMMFQDPEVQQKYPTAAKVLNALEDAGSAAGDAMRREIRKNTEKRNKKQITK